MSDYSLFINKWTPGYDYGPVLSPVELYALDGTSDAGIKLDINPVLAGTDRNKSMGYDISTGQYEAVGDRATTEQYADEPAVIPRMSELIVYTKHSPWITIVRNEGGVTCGDVCRALTQTYSQPITETEFAALPPRAKAAVNRDASNRHYYHPYPYSPGTPGQPNAALRRVAWLQGRVYIHYASIDDKYAEKRFGYSAPNMLCLELSQ